VRFYCVDEVCALFDIHEATLRRWRSDLGHASQPNPADRRRLLISSTDLVELGRMHRRVIVDEVQSKDDVLLMARIEHVADRVSVLASMVERLIAEAD
jgi:transposase-like protein